MEILILFIVCLFCFAIFLYGFRLYQKAVAEDDSIPGYLKGPSQPDEYSRLLALFDLDDSASVEDIKAAYRKVMREHHPDTAREQTPEEVEKFIELKRAHDRILEIKRGVFGR